MPTFTSLKSYVSNVFSNVAAFSRAGASSISSLRHSETPQTIIRAFRPIAQDMLQASLAYYLNQALQDYLQESQEELTEESEWYALLTATATLAANMVLNGFIINRTVRGATRSFVLITTAIPPLLNYEEDRPRHVGLSPENNFIGSTLRQAQRITSDVSEIMSYAILKNLRRFFATHEPENALMSLLHIITRSVDDVWSLYKKAGIVPGMLTSPQRFLDDEVISQLLHALPPGIKQHIRDNYSQIQIEHWLQDVVQTLTGSRNRALVQRLSRGLAVAEWTQALEQKLDDDSHRTPPRYSSALRQFGIYRSASDEEGPSSAPGLHQARRAT
ncbi:hypothetical protein [Legionella spiritensis]|uniref:hypothetical protein n=1 Tax=Legionella spiritensis TaxID=452 RepID=UPI000F6C133E|nr:hypothetical protein [Legionella spiritensis]VEG91869.1 Uncharacterised protein [Legionella spiritensis]